jgi:uncharacterized membrane protein
MPIDVILSRWLHVISACLLIGGVFFIRFILPRGLALVDETQAKSILYPIRRTFKMVLHTTVLFLILTGIYNTWLAWDKYQLDKAVLHALWGTHVLLAALAITLSLYLFAGHEPPKTHRKWMAMNFLLLLCVVAASSSLKWARERAVAAHQANTHPAENP